MCDTFDMTQYDGVAGAHATNVCSMAMAPDGTALATSGYDGLVKIWTGPPASRAAGAGEVRVELPPMI